MYFPETAAELWAFVLTHFGVRLGHKSFTDGHSNPLGFVYDAYFHPDRDIAVWASRSGGKTLGASIVAALEYLKYDRLQGRVLSGSEDQAKFLYGYWERWCNTVLAHRLDGPVKRLQTLVGQGKFEILAASQKKVRGGKVQRLYEDELDEIDPEIDSAAVGMLTSREGLAARTVYTSTWHRADGLMNRLVDACSCNGVALHKWNIWEAIQKCPPERHKNGSGCDHCVLEPTCRAKARDYHNDEAWKVGIAAESDGLYQIDDAIKAYRKVAQSIWDAEFLCKRPTVEGVVYGEFDPTAHRCPDPPGNLVIYRSIDWGCGVFVCLWIGVATDGCAYLLDTYRSENGMLAQHAEYINSHTIQNVRKTYCDPAGRNRSDQTGRSNVEIFREYGIRCDYTLSSRLRNVARGIDMVRSMLAPAGNEPRFYYVPCENNEVFVKAMQNYRNRRVNGVYIDQPQDPQEFEHIPDALRYFVINQSRPSEVRLVGYRMA